MTKKKTQKKKIPNQPKGKTIICRTCKTKVSANAKRCPKCGTQLKLSTAGLIFLIAFIVVIVVSALIVMSGH